jgi:hypothetical protein
VVLAEVEHLMLLVLEVMPLGKVQAEELVGLLVLLMLCLMEETVAVVWLLFATLVVK